MSNGGSTKKESKKKILKREGYQPQKGGKKKPIKTKPKKK